MTGTVMQLGKEVRYVIQLNYRDSKPIYEQIKEGLRKLVITGVIARDEKLPSVRELAAELVINPNTIQRAYRELEQEGYIYTISGKGSFAAEQSDVNGRRNEELLKQFDEIVRELLYLSEDKEALIRRIEEIAKGGTQQ
jgi:GntR family transcriptional regulator